MRSVGSHSTSRREKEGNKERTGSLDESLTPVRPTFLSCHLFGDSKDKRLLKQIFKDYQKQQMQCKKISDFPKCWLLSRCKVNGCSVGNLCDAKPRMFKCKRHLRPEIRYEISYF